MNRPTTHSFRLTALSALFIASVAAAQNPVAAAGSASGLPVLAVATAPFSTSTVVTGSAESASSSSSVAPSDENSTSDPSVAGPVRASETALPDAPSTNLRSSLPETFLFSPMQGQAAPTIAPKLTKYIPSGWTAQTLTAHDKVLLGLRDLYSPLDLIAVFAAAGYEQALNGEPNYGTDRGAFGQRLGAAAIRESSQGLLTDSVFSPLFREDPRYYVQGPSHGVFYRAAYAATRPFITRTDSGNSTINAALLAGYAGSAALSYAYYPQINRNFRDTASTFGGSLGGAALGYAVSEFSDDLLKAVHLRKK